MSYCRFSEGDVYAYDSEGGVRFYISDNRRDLDRLCRTYNEAYQYMKTLRDQYELDVPDHAIDALKADATEEAERIGGPNGVVSDLLDENAKLRELVRQMHTCLTRPKVYAGASSPYLIATKCPYFTQGACDYNSCGFELRMRELGVEP